MKTQAYIKLINSGDTNKESVLEMNILPTEMANGPKDSFGATGNPSTPLRTNLIRISRVKLATTKHHPQSVIPSTLAKTP